MTDDTTTDAVDWQTTAEAAYDAALRAREYAYDAWRATITAHDAAYAAWRAAAGSDDDDASRITPEEEDR